MSNEYPRVTVRWRDAVAVLGPMAIDAALSSRHSINETMGWLLTGSGEDIRIAGEFCGYGEADCHDVRHITIIPLRMVIDIHKLEIGDELCAST